MIKYSDDIKEKALKMMTEIGPTKTCKEMHIGNQTLYRWKKKQRSMMSLVEQPQAEPTATDKNRVQEIESSPSSKCLLTANQSEIKAEKVSNDLQHADPTINETINYLIIENQRLRERCKRYLKALSLITR